MNNSEKYYVYYPELFNTSEWGKDYVILNNDTNLLENTSYDNSGFCIINIENVNELLQNFIKNKIFVKTGKNIKLEQYHNLLNESEHSLIINSMPYKKNSEINISKFSTYIENKVSTILNKKVKIFNDDIWIRICRPTHLYNNDFNPCHRDVYLDFYRNIVNIYIPIAGSDENSSLNIQEGSHKWNENITRVTSNGAYFPSTNKKYSVDAIVASKIPLEMIRPNPNIDEVMIFSPYLIHGCANNDNINTTRFSLEIRFIEINENGSKQEELFNNFLQKRNWR